jgi:hypothetical protein
MIAYCITRVTLSAGALLLIALLGSWAIVYYVVKWLIGG